MRRLVVVASAVLALMVACASGDLSGAVAGGDDDVSVSMSKLDSLDALPAVPAPQLIPPPSSGGVFVELQFPPSRVAIADVFRPPQG
jgi:hypothetical protein